MRPTEAQHRDALALHATRLARYLRNEFPTDSWRPVRLSYGLYYQLDHTSHMQRIKLPGGIMTADQIDVLADVTDRYGRGIAHITTRQDIQIHWVPVAQIMEMYDQLLAVGITTRGACADTVRNVTGCPYAGVSPDEPFDVTPYILAVHEYFLFNPLNLTLPRKFKIAVEGCPLDCAQVPVNDIGLYATDARRAARVRGVGGRRPGLAAVPGAAHDRLHPRHRHAHLVRGHRPHPAPARRAQEPQPRAHEVRGEEDGSREVPPSGSGRGRAGRRRARCRAARRGPRGAPPTAGSAAGDRAGARDPEAPGFAHWAAHERARRSGSRDTGRRSCSSRSATSTSEQMRALATIARRFGNGTLRATDDQNIVLPWVAEAALPAVLRGARRDRARQPRRQHHQRRRLVPGHGLLLAGHHALDGHGRAHPRAPAGGRRGIRRAARRLRREDQRLPQLVRPASRRRHRPDRPHRDRGRRRAAPVLLDPGGRLGRRGRGRIGKRLGRYREEDASAAVAALARYYERERNAGERFPEFVDRVGMPSLVDVAKTAVASA